MKVSRHRLGLTTQLNSRKCRFFALSQFALIKINCSDDFQKIRVKGPDVTAWEEYRMGYLSPDVYDPSGKPIRCGAFRIALLLVFSGIRLDGQNPQDLNNTLAAVLKQAGFTGLIQATLEPR